jgi:glycosyltransferase involved in cell wall biosynthesis
MSAPIFSLVMPAYNAEDYLEEALDSVFGQETRFAFEVILVDDGSTDGTARIAQRFRSHCTKRRAVSGSRLRAMPCFVAQPAYGEQQWPASM